MSRLFERRVEIPPMPEDARALVLNFNVSRGVLLELRLPPGFRDGKAPLDLEIPPGCPIPGEERGDPVGEMPPNAAGFVVAKRIRCCDRCNLFAVDCNVEGTRRLRGHNFAAANNQIKHGTASLL